MFIDDDVINMIVRCTNNYAATDCNDVTFQTDADEMRKVIGIMYVTGYHTLPSIKSYWSVVNPSLGCPIIKASMNRNRFWRVKSYIHVCDNEFINPDDKFAKVTPLNNMMNERFMQFGVFACDLSIDEQMIAYFGRHSCKMFIKGKPTGKRKIVDWQSPDIIFTGKPIRFGFKYWCLCSSEGYLFSFIPYAGASENNNKEFKLGENVVLRLLSNLEKTNQHCVAFDNFFTSHRLMSLLSSKGYFATGTVRENRTGIVVKKGRGKNATVKSIKPDLTDVKTMMRLPRGSWELSFDRVNEVLAVRWNDNSVVTVLSNHLKHEPLHSAKRFDRKEKKMGQIEMPHPIYEYNRTMGGVDLFDNAMNNYRIRVRGKKWYWPLFTNALDAAMVNAWKLHCLCRKFEKKAVMPQLEFRVFVAECLLRSSKVKAAVMSKKESESSASSVIRCDRLDHAIIKAESRTRCRHCKSQTTYKCNKCDVGVHAKCFDAYHKAQKS